MSRVTKSVETIKEVAKNPEYIRNIAIAAHIDHGKTTLSDNLLAGSGIISEELAGNQRFTDFDAQEQERGITIYSANVSMVHEYEGKPYVINLIDTPGHVDFGGDVTRAMRAVDGVVVLIDAVEGVMPQTETVLRQALKERVKPVLFINKVDRFIKELKLGPQEMIERFQKHVITVNRLIKKYAPSEFADEWQVDVNTGKVAFGSAYRNWAVSVPFMQKTGINFKDIIDATNQDKEKEIAKKAPLYEVVFDMVIKHLPTPPKAQKYRIGKIWTGDVDSKEGQAMVNFDQNAPVIGVITNVATDPHAGLVCTARLFSGTVREGQELKIVNIDKKVRIQQVSVFAGPRRINMQEIPCGNIVGLTGISDATAGYTICDPSLNVAPFEEIKHVFEPVVTKAIEAKNVKDLPKLIDVLRQRANEDPTIKVQISEDTGEMLVSGLGELHIEAKIERYLKEKGVDVVVSPPIIIYKEGVAKLSQEFEGKSPNKHNKFYIKVEPITEQLEEVLHNEDLPQGKIREKDKDYVVEMLVKGGMDRDTAKRCMYIHEDNIFLNMTKGIVQLNEVIELVLQATQQVLDAGPLADEPVKGMKVMLMDAKLHEDAIHRGPAQVYPAVRMAIKNAMLDAKAALFEPKQVMRIDAPSEYMGSVIKEVQNRRGQIIEMNEEEGVSIVTAKIPVAEMSGFESSLKSATGGKGFQSLVDVLFEKLPQDLQEKTILSIRKRKGMKEEIPKISEETDEES